MDERTRHRRAPARVGLTAATAAVLVLFATVLASVPAARSWDGAAVAGSQVLLPVALASALFVSVAHQLTGHDGLAWLAAGLGIVGVQGLPALVAAPTPSGFAAQVPLLSAIVVGLVLLAFARLASLRRLPLAPIPTGLGIGLGLLVLRAAWTVLPSGVTSLLPEALTRGSRAVDLVGFTLIMTTGLVVAALVSRSTSLALGAPRLGAAAVLWSLTQAVGALGWIDRPLWSLVVVAASLATGVLVGSATLDLLCAAIRDDRETAQRLEGQVLSLRERHREGLEQLHEVKGSIAGIASATGLIHGEERLSSQHRSRLAELLISETERLQRLVHLQPRRSDPTPVDLDSVVAPLVLSRRLQGQEVSWTPPSAPTLVPPVGVAEAVNILLHNASVHAPGAPVRVFTRTAGDDLELLVVDSGPGVPEQLHDRLFEWGVSRPESPGQGVGLAMARRLLERRGCTIALEPARSGARFRITVPAAAVGAAVAGAVVEAVTDEVAAAPDMTDHASEHTTEPLAG